MRTLRVGPAEGGRGPAILIRTPYGIGWNPPLFAMPIVARFFARPASFNFKVAETSFAIWSCNEKMSDIFFVYCWPQSCESSETSTSSA